MLIKKAKKSCPTATARARTPIETLENRRLLSAAVYHALPAGGANPAALAVPGSSSIVGYTPSQIRGAYGVGNISFNGTTGDGSGQTIALIVAHDNPKLVPTGSSAFASSDLHNFDVAFGLPDPPSFKKVDEYGSTTSYPSTDPGWANEAALDVEWAHAMAPKANILLVEAYSDNVYPSGTSDLLKTAVQYAEQQPGVSVVSMSFALGEFSGETNFDSVLTTPGNHNGVTFVAASGDNGSPPQYPAVSPNVVGVGATNLSVSGSSYGSESGIAGSGGGISAYESKPSYQYGLTQSSSMRMSPDVAFDGDKNTGAAVYDSFNGGASTPWYKVGGTSFSSPAWAGLIAIADQGRALANLGTLNGATQTLPRLYELNQGDFHDITSGNNGYSAGGGYDLVTGRGTPNAGSLVPHLAGGNSISGTVFSDTNGNGKQDAGEMSLGGWGVFIDLYGTGVRQGLDPYTTSSSNGSYTLNDLPGGTFHVTQGTVSGYTRTAPTTYYSVGLNYRNSDGGYNVADHPNSSGGGGGTSNTAKIQGTVYTDVNNDAKYDSGDTTLGGVTLYMDVNKDGKLDNNEPTYPVGSNGYYYFGNLPAGVYRIAEITPSGYHLTNPTVGYFDITVQSGWLVSNENFGNSKTTSGGVANPASIAGTVFNDENGDGKYDNSDYGTGGWGVFLDLNHDGVYDGNDYRTYTNSSGYFYFGNLPPGTYYINEGVPSGYKRTAVSTAGYTITVSAGQVVTGLLFGNQYLG